MTTDGPSRTAIPVGPTAEAVARNLWRIRKARGLSTRALSAMLKRMGRPISQDAICKMENVARPDAKHLRRVDVDDLMALAVALDVSPSALLLPLNDSPESTIDITGAGPVAADEAWDWVDGCKRLDQPCTDPGAAALEYAIYSRPPIRRNKELGREA